MDTYVSICIQYMSVGTLTTESECTSARHRRLPDRLVEARGRKRAGLDISLSPYLRPSSGGDLARFAELGVTRVVLLAMAPSVDAIPATLDKVVREYGPLK